MSYDTARKACRENLQLLQPHTKDLTYAALYNITVAISNVADAVSQDVGRLESLIANLQRSVQQKGR